LGKPPVGQGDLFWNTDGPAKWKVAGSFATQVGVEAFVGYNTFQPRVSSPTGKFYSVAYETKLPSNLYPKGSYPDHFRASNTSLYNTMQTDAVFSSKMNALGIEIPMTKRGKIGTTSPKDWVWHHDVEPGTMQLVPQSQHPPGFGKGIFWLTLHPEGKGGMSIWN
jgi:hypothetical protein